MSWKSALKRAGRAIGTFGYSEVPGIKKYVNKGIDSAEDAIKGAISQKSNKVEQAETGEGSSLEELQAQGRAAAGTSAADSAGIAKQSAKAATMQTSGNKMAAAANAAAAAGNAAQQGYSDTSNSMTGLAANTEQSNLSRLTGTSQFNAGQQNQADQAKKARQTQMFNSMASLGGTLGTAIASDETKKKVKHTYIPVENRVHRGE